MRRFVWAVMLITALLLLPVQHLWASWPNWNEGSTVVSGSLNGQTIQYKGTISTLSNSSGISCYVSHGNSTNLRSGSQIILKPGFNAMKGSSFTAVIAILCPSGDCDNDGMLDQWELDNGLDTYSNDSQMDSDGDGFVNVVEYAAGTGPTNSGSVPEPGNYYKYDALGRIKSIVRLK